MKRFNVVIPTENGGVEGYPLKEWLRQHSEKIPHGLDATTSTSHQLRNGLKKMGWQVHETEAEVRLFLPGSFDSQIVDSLLGEPETELEADSDSTAAFALEHHLRDFIAENISTISVAGKRLSLYVDQTGRDGIEYPTTVGSIDILAVDDEGAFFVFELKRSRGSDKTVGQLARYMGWVKNTIGKGKNVNGVIVAKSIDDKLRFAASIIPKVNLFEYEVDFRLNNADDITG